LVFLLTWLRGEALDHNFEDFISHILDPQAAAAQHRGQGKEPTSYKPSSNNPLDRLMAQILNQVEEANDVVYENIVIDSKGHKHKTKTVKHGEMRQITNEDEDDEGTHVKQKRIIGSKFHEIDEDISKNGVHSGSDQIDGLELNEVSEFDQKFEAKFGEAGKRDTRPSMLEMLMRGGGRRFI